jgi:glyoxylase-like metal-dependent hydrolase (beta-lactamase superfamily II)
MELAPSLHRLGSSSLVNSYLIEDAAAITVIDAGLRGHWKDLLRELEAMGRSPVDIRALLLTHGDVDHLGFAEWLRQEHGVPVFVGAADAPRHTANYPSPPP